MRNVKNNMIFSEQYESEMNTAGEEERYKIEP